MLRFVEGFDHYGNDADAVKKGWSTFSTHGSQTGRFGGYCRSINNDNAQITFDSQGTWIIGFAWKTNGTPSATAFQFLIDTGTGTQVYLAPTGTGSLFVANGGGTVIAWGTAVISPSVWHYVEWKVVIGNSGSAEIRVDGVTIASGSGDTQYQSSSTANKFMIANNISTESLYDDMYFCDGQGSAPTNDFLGDCRVQTLVPNGNGNSSQFVGSDGNSTDNYLLVDDTWPDGDYVQSPTTGNKDTYAFPDLTATSGSVYGVQIMAYAMKTDSGTRNLATVARLSGGTEADSSDFALPTSYGYVRDLRETKPGGGSWSISDVNGAEFGVKVTG